MSDSRKKTFKEENKDLVMPKRYCRVSSHLRKVEGKKKRVRVKGYIKECRRELP